MAMISTFTEKDLRILAGEQSFERGQGYIDAVADLEVGADGLTATVHGGSAYKVTLTIDADEELGGECDCPYGLDGNFCKHCVAVGLVVLHEKPDLRKERAAAARRGRSLESWLDALPRDRLLAIVREQLAKDQNLRRRLELRAATEQADPDIVILRAQITKLLDTAPFVQYGYMEYADAPAYAAQVEEAARTLRSLTAAGKASTTVTLAREAIDRLHGVYEQIDDSSGTICGVSAELEEAHREACATSDADPAGTAEWLATHMLGGWSHVPEIDLGDYWDLLGNAGRARFSELVAEASRHSGAAWATNYLGREIARLEGNIDALVAALAADPDPYGRTHHQIAEELDRAGRSDEALEWAERGLRDSSPPPFEGDALADYVAKRYEGEGRLADTVTVRRERFRASPSLAGYRSLREAARKAGRWDTERTAALNLLRDAEPAREAQILHGSSLLVDALIDDGDTDGAWQAAEGRAGDRQWLELADLVRDEHPAKTLEVYRRAIETRTRLTGNGNYREVATLLLQARDCHRRLGSDSDFTAYVTDLRTAQRRKRNLMKILDERGL